MAEMQRRDFLKKAGTGAIAVASLPAWVGALSRVASADGNEKGWHFVVVSHAGTKDLVALVGAGEVESDEVEGGGSFVHWDASAAGLPKPILASGTWKAKRLISFERVADPTHKGGALAAGELKMRVRLFREIPSPAEIRATLKVVCNLGFAGLSVPGEEEGVTLAIPDTPFARGATPGPFEPFVPALGLTSITRKVVDD